MNKKSIFLALFLTFFFNLVPMSDACAQWSAGATIDKFKSKRGVAESQYSLSLRYSSGDGVEKNYLKAFKWMNKSADQNHIKAMYDLGILYSKGIGTEKNDLKAYEWVKKSAIAGYDKAQYKLGHIFIDGTGVDKNVDKGIKWFKKAAIQNNSAAQNYLGFIYEFPNIYLNDDYSEEYDKLAFNYYMSAANNGHNKAQQHLGSIYMRGNDYISKDYSKAKKWHSKSAEDGNIDSILALGKIYEFGYGVDKDYSKAFDYYMKGVMREDNKYTVLPYKIGLFYLNGYGVEKNIKKAIKWFQKANKLSYSEHENSSAALAYIYYSDPKYKDIEKSTSYLKLVMDDPYYELLCINFSPDKHYNFKFWIQKLADNGHPYSQYIIGKLYNLGYCFEKNIESSLEWLNKSSEHNIVESHNELGKIYLNKNEKYYDIEKSIFWFNKAAKEGFIDSQIYLAKIYGDNLDEEHSDITKLGVYDREKALFWYLKAAKKGDAESQYIVCYNYYKSEDKELNKEGYEWCMKAVNQDYISASYYIGSMHLKGIGVKKDYNEAFNWYMKGANSGIPLSLNEIGKFYEKGMVVLQNEVKAYAYYSLANSYYPHKKFLSNRNRIEKKLSNEEIEEGRNIAADFKNKIESEFDIELDDKASDVKDKSL